MNTFQKIIRDSAADGGRFVAVHPIVSPRMWLPGDAGIETIKQIDHFLVSALQLPSGRKDG